MQTAKQIKSALLVISGLIIAGFVSYDFITQFYYQSRIESLLDSSRQAFHIKNLRQAQADATELLKISTAYSRLNLHSNFSTYGDAIHYGNIILGIVALTRNDISAASNYLILAASTPGSPELNKFGPCMMLAEALLQRGRRDIVLEYLKRCSRFWTNDEGHLNTWIQEVSGGGIPDFGKRLCI